MMQLIHHRESADVLEHANYITGPFVGTEGKEWRVLAERLGRRPLKCFEVTLESSDITVSPGVVHNDFYPEVKFVLSEPCAIWLTYTATFSTATASVGGSAITYRLPGPQKVEAQIIQLPIEEDLTNSNVDPDSLTIARKLGTFTRSATGWSLTGGSGIYPVTISALGGFTL